MPNGACASTRKIKRKEKKKKKKTLLAQSAKHSWWEYIYSTIELFRREMSPMSQHVTDIRHINTLRRSVISLATAHAFKWPKRRHGDRTHDFKWRTKKLWRTTPTARNKVIAHTQTDVSFLEECFDLWQQVWETSPVNQELFKDEHVPAFYNYVNTFYLMSVWNI